jgi:hypothetical protein
MDGMSARSCATAAWVLFAIAAFSVALVLADSPNEIGSARISAVITLICGWLSGYFGSHAQLTPSR